jgi:hypothetical protein
VSASTTKTCLVNVSGGADDECFSADDMREAHLSGFLAMLRDRR